MKFIHSSLLVLLVLSTVKTLFAADNTVIGTIEANFQGEDRVWYILQPDTGLMPTAFWIPVSPTIGAAALTAYDSTSIEFERDMASGASLPKDDSSVLVITISFMMAPGNDSHSPPGAASVHWLSDWRDNNGTFELEQEAGSFETTVIQANREGHSQFSGTFAGTLQDKTGNMIVVTNGRFDVDGAAFQTL